MKKDTNNAPTIPNPEIYKLEENDRETPDTDNRLAG